MNDKRATASGAAWDAIDNEKKRDRFIRRVSMVAWSVTGVLALLLTILVGGQAVEMARAAMLGALPWMSVAGIMMPLVIALGMLAVLIATVSTIGMFVRMRAASLHEIQLRLAALEDLLASRGGSVG